MLKVIFDTNIWVSYFIGKKTTELTELILDFDLEVITSNTLILELSDVLQRPKIKKYLHRSKEEYLQIHIQLSLLKDVQPIYNNSPDPKDNFLFDLAIQEKANYLVTGDKKLFEVPPIKELIIITLSDFKNLLNLRLPEN
ncbi:putative toxin-antitoxin system toxin component, PIN family [Emticicia sp. 21SJ11W-3]|uniref:putative toxin-antitoxin system toxin component, PIN family n=1 Tax=Emticicia sp. 21SJ11W-3 TaxID=2916755 RepID=UPI00209D3617|nr:putative toxin-antitoxin system toxin component, PIN family [Emticicia sp. 21SJ11W-3]UTA66331.1 putative toxin-antitoxin system toxin component, PIN family [Emticicia sp. 21SJ11W-3]